jgi:hypothetical protein
VPPARGGGGCVRVWLCARAPGLTLVLDPGWLRIGDEMFDGVIPRGEALRPLDLSRRYTRGGVPAAVVREPAAAHRCE